MYNDADFTYIRFCEECEKVQVCSIHKQELIKKWQSPIPPRYKTASLLEFSKVIKDKVVNYFKCIEDNKKETGLYIHGDVGIGKTRLMYAIANHLCKATEIKSQTQKPPFINEDCKSLIFQMHACYVGRGEANNLPDFIKQYVSASIRTYILLDDLGHGGTTVRDFGINALNILIDGIYGNCGKLIITSNHDLSTLKVELGYYAGDRILEMCGDNIIELHGKSKRIG
jgi:DNA replication protein DnaC